MINNDHAHLGMFVILRLVLVMAFLHTKLEVCIFSHCKYMKEDKKVKIGLFVVVRVTQGRQQYHHWIYRIRFPIRLIHKQCIHLAPISRDSKLFGKSHKFSYTTCI